MYTVTNPPRADGTRSRRYGCEGARQKRCDALWVDAEIVDSLFVANLHVFLGLATRQHTLTEGGQPTHSAVALDGTVVLAEQLKRAISDALASGDSGRADRLVDELVAHREWIVLNQRHAPSLGNEQRTAHELLVDFYRWSANERAGGTPDATEHADRLNMVLRGWFDRVEITHRRDDITVLPILKSAPTARFDGHDGVSRPPENPAALRVRKGDWTVALRTAGIPHRRGEPWHREEIVHALVAWARANGRSPKYADWGTATRGHPNNTTVIHHFGHWTSALRIADLPPIDDLRRDRARRRAEQ
jgi:hypothetical protein